LAQITLLSAATATNSAPTAATDGAAIPHLCDVATLFLHSTAGSVTMTVTCKLWGYNTQLAKWYPLGTNATAASKGLLNEGNAMGETGTDSIRHCEALAGLRAIQRLYLEITAIGGTSTAITAVVDCAKADGSTT
jgi:hypothetical protein